LSPEFDEPLSNFASNFNLRRYTKAEERAAAAAAAAAIAAGEVETMRAALAECTANFESTLAAGAYTHPLFGST